MRAGCRATSSSTFRPATAGTRYLRNDGVAGQVNTVSSVTNAADDGLIADIDPDWPHSWWSIIPRSPLPTFSNGTIDGFSQAAGTPQAAAPNTNGAGLGIDAALRIEVAGNLTKGDGLTLGGDATLRGLVINGCPGLAIVVSSGGNKIQGNFIGTDPSGTRGKTNQGGAVYFAAAPIIGWARTAMAFSMPANAT